MKCEIELRRLNQNRIFSAGEALNGSVILKINDLSIINEICCQIIGYAKCTWSVESSIYYMHGRSEHLNASFLLLHKPINGQAFAKGRYSFQFYYQLPQSLPSSFSSFEGCVKYKMLITVKRFGKSDARFEYPFIVRQVVDLNLLEELARPLLKVTSKEFTIDFTSKCLYMTAMIPQQGYVPHQIMDVRVQVDNRSIVYVKYVKISLKKIVTFTSQSPNVHQHTTESTVAIAYCGDVAAHEKKFFIKYLKIPQIPPNIDNCQIIKVGYELQVKAKTVGVTRSPILKLPIQIGTIQLFRDTSRDYDLDVLEPRRLEFAPLSYEECISGSSYPITPTNDDLIDFNLPSYDEALKLNGNKNNIQNSTSE